MNSSDTKKAGHLSDFFAVPTESLTGPDCISIDVYVPGGAYLDKIQSTSLCITFVGFMIDVQEHTGPNQHALLFVVEELGKFLCTLTHALVCLGANVKSRSDTGHDP